MGMCREPGIVLTVSQAEQLKFNIHIGHKMADRGPLSIFSVWNCGINSGLYYILPC